jgi:hypothetical protein
MDLGGWNSDLEDSSLLNNNYSSSSIRLSPRDDTNSWDGNLNHLLPGFNVDYETAPSEKSKSSEQMESSKTLQESRSYVPGEATTAQNITNHRASHDSSRHVAAVLGSPFHTAPISETSSLTSASKTGASSVSGLSSDTSCRAPHRIRAVPSNQSNGGCSNGVGGNNNYQNVPQLHPMGIQSSATCPPHSTNNNSTANKTSLSQFGQMPPTSMIHQQQQQQPQQTAPSNMYGLAGANSANVASLAASMHSAQAAASATANHHLSSLQANFMMAQASSGQAQVPVSPPAMVAAVIQPQHHAPTALPHQHHRSQHSVTDTSASLKSGSSSSSSSKPSSSSSSKRSSSRPQKQQQQASSQHNSTSPPPFYLFDAPIELRANFLQNQRKLGIPIQHDPNSYHYGETVKGFHPQQLLSQQPGQPGQPAHRIPVQLIDARHGNHRQQGSGRVKNEREQKRAQKITELIDQLRINMENGGWKVEMRSKFHTLSS